MEGKYFKTSKILKIKRDSSKEHSREYTQALRELGRLKKDRDNREKVLRTRPTESRKRMYEQVLQGITYWSNRKAELEALGRHLITKRTPAKEAATNGINIK